MAFRVDIKLEFNDALLRDKIDKASEKGIAAVSNEALKDANKYARKDTGEMIRSSLRASQPGKGELVWDTPYAKKVYYTGNPSTGRNPDASKLWAHKGYAENHKKYEGILDKVAKEEV